MNFRRQFFFAAVWIASAGVARADGLQAQLDYPEQKLEMNQPTILQATLTNGSTTLLYITGIRIDISHNASGGLYKENVLLQQLRSLGPQQSWEGPLVTMTPSHRGTLIVRGSIIIQGGSALVSSGTLTEIPVLLPIDDPDRDRDGNFLRGTEAACDRPSDGCCDAEESECFQKGGHCVYIAEGFNSQRVCSDRFPGSVCDHIANLQVSGDGAHEAYLSSDHCVTDPHGITCHYRVVTDGQPSAVYEAVNGPCFSPDGLHVAYQAGTQCVRPLSAAEGTLLRCRVSAVMIDGAQTPALPAWCAIPPAALSFAGMAKRSH